MQAERLLGGFNGEPKQNFPWFLLELNLDRGTGTVGDLIEGLAGWHPIEGDSHSAQDTVVPIESDLWLLAQVAFDMAGNRVCLPEPVRHCAESTAGAEKQKQRHGEDELLHGSVLQLGYLMKANGNGGQIGLREGMGQQALGQEIEDTLLSYHPITKESWAQGRLPAFCFDQTCDLPLLVLIPIQFASAPRYHW
jgi:hypothetical protein